ncbi:hypothetical protein [Streptomyces sp. NPDC056628]
MPGDHPRGCGEQKSNVLARCPELEQAAEHVREFGEILTDRLGSTLPT